MRWYLELEDLFYDRLKWYECKAKGISNPKHTFTINDDGEVITMVFPKEEIADVPVGVDVGGTFALVVDEEEEYVTLNGILFSKA